MNCFKVTLLTGLRCVIEAIKCDPTTIDIKLVIVLFLKNLYNKDISWRVAGDKTINTLLDAFKTAQWNLFKLKKYEGLVSKDNSIHTITLWQQQTLCQLPVVTQAYVIML